MFNNLFKKSLTKSGPKLVELEKLAKANLSSDIFKDFKGDISIEVKFDAEEVKKSIASEELLFTNYLSERTDATIISAIERLAKDLTIINNNIKSVQLNEDNIERLNLYPSNAITEDDFVVFKSELTSTLESRNPTRIYIKYDYIVESEASPRGIYSIIMIDPFHLVISSKHTINNKSIGSAEMRKRNYYDNKNNEICISMYIN